MTNSNELLQNALKSMSNEDKAKIFPPIERKNFVEIGRASCRERV